MKKSTLNILQLLAVLVVTTCLFIAPATAYWWSWQQQPPAQEDQQLVRANFQLPKLFNFEQFQTLFHKHYNSFLEELVRRKIFLGRAFQAFVSAVSYRHWRSPFFLRVNDMSDWTEKDFEQSRIPADKLTDLTPEERQRLRDEVTAAVAAGADSVSGEEVLDENLAEMVEDELVEEHEGDPGFKEMQEELAQVKKNKEAVFRSAPDDFSTTTTTESSLEQQVTTTATTTTTTMSLPAWAKQNNGPNFFQSLADKAKSLLFRPREDSFMIMDYRGPDEVIVDHRKSKCFTQPRKQSKCGCCYAFATTALFEWMYCKQTGKKIVFSEQYMVDCGRAAGLEGCEGGLLRLGHEFVEHYGLFTRSLYPYRDREDTCPFDNSFQRKQMGHMRLNTIRKSKVNWKQLDKYLARGPLVVGFSVGKSFAFYGGGVHSNPECKDTDGHALLLVGSGREGNRKYWLLRNSFSVSWGEAGYYKIDQVAFAKCLLDGDFVQITGQLEENTKLKARNKALAQRYRQNFASYSTTRRPKVTTEATTTTTDSTTELSTTAMTTTTVASSAE